MIAKYAQEHGKEVAASLEKARHALMHGGTLKEKEGELCKTGDELVNILGRIVFRALLSTFPKDPSAKRIKVTFPNSYIRSFQLITAFVTAEVPEGENGELDLDNFIVINVAETPAP